VQTTQLSTLAQGIGYLIAAVCTFAVGALRDSFSSWLPGLSLILIATLAQTVAGYISGKPGRISSAI
jgi:CP family cyanate transporter-like MFS transporter